MENDQIKIGYRELEFTGLKFKEDESRYPWENKKDADLIFDSLIDEGSEFSEMRYNNLLRIQFEEDIHVKLSFSLISKLFSYLSLGIVFLLIFANITIPALIGLGVSVLAYLFSKYFNNKVRSLYMSMEIIPNLVELLFSEDFRETK